MDISKLTLAKNYDPHRLREIVRHEFHVTASISWLDVLLIGCSVALGFFVGAGLFWMAVA
jgi:hypothetical protein